MFGKRPVVPVAIAGGLLLAVLLPATVLARGTFTSSACYNSGDQTENFTMSWSGFTVNAYGFGAGTKSTGQGFGFIAPITAARQGTESWSVNLIGSFVPDVAGGDLYIGNNHTPGGHLTVVASFSVDEPTSAGGWADLPPC
ncbi:MAG TPA: hypothetical protein VKR30_11990 [Candidatus Limnocylindrales bacterium]|nr:hypothetical protein [Candidatus Limnocylindrales bacterium]